MDAWAQAVMAEIDRAGRVPDGAKLRWGTVTSTSPLRVRLGSDPDPLNLEPDTLTPVATGDRVLCALTAAGPGGSRGVAILGKVGAPRVVSGVTYGGDVPTLIAFPTGLFTDPPAVILRNLNGGAFHLTSAVATTGVWYENDGPGNDDMHWIAVQS